jgi:hypothetical protein
MKLLVVGFDGVSPDVFQRAWPIDVRPLRTEIALSGPSWTTIYTGLAAAEHKVYTPVGQPSQGGQSYADLEGKVVWDEVGAHGYRVGLVNLPCAIPVREVNGFHVTGYPAVLGEVIWPEDLKVPSEYLQMADLGHYGEWTGRGWRGWGQHLRAQVGSPAEVLALVGRHTEALTAWFIRTLPGCNAELGWICYTFPDRLGHLYGQTGETLATIVDLIAWTMGMLTGCVIADSVLVVSDHGFKQDGSLTTEEGHEPEGVIAATGRLQEVINSRPYWFNWNVAELVLSSVGIPGRATFVEGYESEEARREVEKRLEAFGYL